MLDLSKLDKAHSLLQNCYIASEFYLPVTCHYSN